MTNLHRGETTIKIGADEYTLRANFGALADLEEHFGLKNLQGIEERLKDCGMKDIGQLLIILSRAGGKEIPMETLRGMSIDEIQAMGETIAETFTNAMDKTDPKTEPAETEDASTGENQSPSDTA